MHDLVGIALALGAEDVAGWSPAERELAAGAEKAGHDEVERFRAAIADGRDPLGDAYQSRRTVEERRGSGATYTPALIVDAMVRWAAGQGEPARVVDPGIGSGRFAVAAGRVFKDATLVGFDIDPVAAILARGHLAAAGMAARAEVVVADYCGATLPAVAGKTLFIGNPPYVRHHGLTAAQKKWLSRTARKRGLKASGLSGLHVHFLVATAEHAIAGDVGVFVTASEWLDVNYGQVLRDLLLGELGGVLVHVVEPEATPFPDAITTAAVTAFEVGARPASLTLRSVSSLDELGELSGGRRVARGRLADARQWTPLFRTGRHREPTGVELGELCTVHRGQVTGANRVWVAGARAAPLPARLKLACITRARELFAAADGLVDAKGLARVVDLPVDLDELSSAEREDVDRFLRWARTQGAADGYVARHRKAWWAVGLRAPAPILASYMARQPPVFVRNLVGARHINIAHGIYPRKDMTDCQLDALVDSLNAAAADAVGRTYAGGLTKFEPREMERIRIAGVI